MYYALKLEKELDMHPRDFGKHCRERIEAKLKAEASDKSFGNTVLKTMGMQTTLRPGTMSCTQAC